MRKIILYLLALSLVLSLTVVVGAAEASLTMTDTPAKADQTIYLGVTLNQSLTADAMGVRYSYDPAILEPLPDSCVWDISGSLSDFGREDSGVWADAQPRDVTGKLFTLAFRLKDGVTLKETTVSCTVVFKNGDSSSTELTATARVYTECDHKYGEWDNTAPIDHSRKCLLCGRNQSEAHSWDAGVISNHPTNPQLNILTKTCSQCGATRSVDISAEVAPTLPTAPPQSTQPTQPAPTLPPLETIPPYTQPELTPTQPEHSFGKPEPDNQNSSVKPTAPTVPTTPTLPTSPTQSMQPTQPVPGHDVTDYNQSGNNPGSNQGSTVKPTEPSSGNSSTTPTVPNSGGTQAETPQPGEPVSTAPVPEYDHSAGETTRVPIAVPVPSGHPLTTTPQPEHDHEHPVVTQPVSDDAPVADQSEAYRSSGLALLAAVAALAAAAGLTVLLIRRIRKSK